ncbi:Hypothetical protein IALB_1575 [Ignavibacterium album JCM 16511]|uniref:Uncharacterized protein n=1 Tax=Ignavibacterium album (strain DSM 19864 / JCM 16511 / NBRC 101810 / Mat9-16) TaxID=945713 RepID=I0AJX6_IGNAJ|nr:Hypothetical protein IALB_1575 [Ignavibacterium album JCM 16511]
MFMKRPQYRRFDYTPRFYKPELDEEERRKRKLGFRNARSTTRRKTQSPLMWLILIIILIFILIKFGRF